MELAFSLQLSSFVPVLWDGNIILLPGDSIEAWVNSIKRYDIDMELVSESYEIEEVIRLHRAKNNDSAAKQESIEGL